MAQISKDMMIADIIGKHPYLAEYIMDYGVHCVGCGATEFESLEEGFMGHGMSTEEVDKVIAELNEVIAGNKDKGTDKEFSITEHAAKKIKEQGEKRHKETFRIKAEKTEGKTSYKFIFDNAVNGDDTLFEDEGIKVIIDKDTLEGFTNTVLDYKDGNFSLEHA